MIDNLDYSQVPLEFTHCFNSNCRQSDRCLHFQVTRHISADRREYRVFNPDCYQSEGDCPEFMSDTPLKYAYGWTHMFDKLVHEKAVAIKHALLRHYGKNDFYRLKRHEKGFSPAEQQYVRGVFVGHGIKEEPVYDKFQYEYKWWRH